jgi:hypothetical protein
MTPQEFIETAPLYTTIELVDFSPPDSITRMCTPCKKDTTWNRITGLKAFKVETQPAITFEATGYTCALCRKNSFAVFYQKMDWTQGRKTTGNPASPYVETFFYKAVRKIGQVPPQQIEIPAELGDRLGSTAGHYKKALICREQNYGIGAMAYLRRVVDENTDELIDVMAELLQTFNVDPKDIGALLDAKKKTQFEEKMKVAAELIPDAVKPGGVNPLGQLYKHTSVGLHGKTDDECIAIFDDLKADFEYVFRNLHLQAEERRQFARRVQERAGKKV